MGERGVVHFGKLFTETNEQKFSLGGVECKKICSHPGRNIHARASKFQSYLGPACTRGLPGLCPPHCYTTGYLQFVGGVSRSVVGC